MFPQLWDRKLNESKSIWHKHVSHGPLRHQRQCAMTFTNTFGLFTSLLFGLVSLVL